MRYLEKAKRLVKDESGMSLVVAMTTLLAMTALSALVFYSSVNSTKIQTNMKQGVQADYAAQSGLTVGEQYMQNAGADQNTTDPTWSYTLPSGTLPNGSSYTVTITHVRTDDGTGVYNATANGSPLYRITSTGTANGSTSVMEEVTAINNYQTLWGNAITACGSLNLNQTSYTDSYNSTNGAYGAQTPGSLGQVYAEGNIFFENNSHANGNVFAAYINSRQLGNVSYDNNSYSIGNTTAGGGITINGQIEKTTGGTGGNAESWKAISGSNHGTIFGTADSGGSVSGVTVDGTTTQNNSNIQQSLVPPPVECNTTNPNIPQVPSNIATSNNDGAVAHSSSYSSGCWGAGSGDDSGPYDCEVSTNGVLSLPGSSDPQNPDIYYYTSLKLGGDEEDDDGEGHGGGHPKIITTGYVRIFVQNELQLGNNAGICGNVLAGNCTATSTVAPAPADVFLDVYGGHRSGDDGEGDDEGAGVTMGNNSFMYGSLYAPTVSSTLKNNFQIFGLAVLGPGSGDEEDDSGEDGHGDSGAVSLDNGGAVHYDAALLQAIGSPAGYTMQYRKKCLYGVMSAPNGQYMAGSCNPGPSN
ncbi:MAG: pilus assembly PilX N-terminal domain-containing protein [Nitrospiraceae bacterium]|nr:pilus assembly PilX N-terminal domain-containing protein [Nitrospiraceae bacterium]